MPALSIYPLASRDTVAPPEYPLDALSITLVVLPTISVFLICTLYSLCHQRIPPSTYFKNTINPLVLAFTWPYHIYRLQVCIISFKQQRVEQWGTEMQTMRTNNRATDGENAQASTVRSPVSVSYEPSVTDEVPPPYSAQAQAEVAPPYSVLAEVEPVAEIRTLEPVLLEPGLGRSSHRVGSELPQAH